MAISGSLGAFSLGQFSLGAIPMSVNIISPAPSPRIFIVSDGDKDEWIGYKTPNEKKSFSFNWLQELNGAQGCCATSISLPAITIATSTWILESSDIIVNNTGTGIDISGTISTVNISAGLLQASGNDNIYNVTNQITDSNGNEYEATFRLYVQKYNY